jgi:four helix bundle protein
MNNFVAYTNGLDLARALRPMIDEVRARSADLADQLERAITSLLLNLAEGNRRYGRDPRRFHVIASGSASEITAALDLACLWGWLRDDDHVRALLDRERRLLWGLTHPKKLATNAAPQQRDRPSRSKPAS